MAFGTYSLDNLIKLSKESRPNFFTITKLQKKNYVYVYRNPKILTLLYLKINYITP